MLRRPQEGGGDQVQPGKGKAQKVEPQALLRHLLERRISVPVEEGHQRPGGEEGQRGHAQPRAQGQPQGHAAQGAHPGGVPPAVGQADQGLDALIDAGEESEGHQRQVGHNAVGRHPQRPRQAEGQQVEDHQHQAGGALVEKGGAAQPGQIRQRPEGGAEGAQAEAAAAGEDVQGGHAQAHYRGDAGGQGRAEDAHIHGVEEHIVQHNVGQAAQQHGGHGQLGIAVVAHEGGENVVE